jgi:hypothetical protein
VKTCEGRQEIVYLAFLGVLCFGGSSLSFEYYLSLALPMIDRVPWPLLGVAMLVDEMHAHAKPWAWHSREDRAFSMKESIGELDNDPSDA